MVEEGENTFLFEGYEEYFESLIPKDSGIVFAHNDV
jgi:thiamine kinase-like enzyme